MRRPTVKSAAYYRANPLSTVEMVAGGLVGAAILGIGGYLLYQHYNAPATTATTAQQLAQPGQFGSANPAPYGYDANGNPYPSQNAADAANLTGIYTVPPMPAGG
jgi:hypothetical protein